MTGTVSDPIEPADVTFGDIQEILDLYDTDSSWDRTLNHFDRLYGGMANTSYKVSAMGKEPRELYVMTFLDGHTDESAKRLTELLFALEGNAGVCPPPVTTASGKAVVEWYDHNIMLRPYVHGTSREATAVELETLGATIAGIHLAPVNAEIIDKDLQRRIHDRWIVNSIATDPTAGAHLDAFRRTNDPTTWDTWTDLPHGVVHGDLLPQNIIWSENTAEITPTIIDWDTACRDALILDLAIAVVGHCRTTSQYARHPLSQERFAALVGGYQSVRPLELAENACLAQTIDFAAAMIAASRISMRVTKDAKRNLPSYREMLAICDTGYDTGSFVDDAYPDIWAIKD